MATFKEMYHADVSPTLISEVANAVIEQVIEWQNRPLEAIYPIVYLDCINEKVHPNKQVIKKRHLPRYGREHFRPQRAAGHVAF